MRICETTGWKNKGVPARTEVAMLGHVERMGSEKGSSKTHHLQWDEPKK